MYSDGSDVGAESEAFIERWKETQPAFVAYYKREWHGKITRWAVNLRLYRHANQNTNGGIERWHHTLKVELKADKSSVSGRSIPWLIERLELIENHYWCMYANKFQGRLRNRTVEQHIHKCMNRAKLIPDHFVTLIECGSTKCASVRSMSEKYTSVKEHLVTHWNNDACSCTCGYSIKGNACKHQIKVLLMTKTITDLDLLTQLGSKMGTFCGGLDVHLKVQNGELEFMTEVADVTLHYDDEEFWDDEPAQPDAVLMSPPLDEFQSILKKAYDTVSYIPSLAVQALKELKAWCESLQTREAQQNVTRLELECHDSTRLETMVPNEESNITTVAKRGWVDKLYKGRRKRKGKDESDKAKSLMFMTSAPEKLHIKKKETSLSFQGKFDKMAVDALQDLLNAVTTDAFTKGCEAPAKKMTRSKKADKALSKDVATSNANVKSSKATRPRKTRASPPYPLQAVKEGCSQSAILSEALTPSQSQVIGNIHIGSSQTWAMSPSFSDLLHAFSVGATWDSSAAPTSLHDANVVCIAD